MYEIEVNSQSTVSSLVSCKNLTIRPLLLLRERSLISTTTDRTSFQDHSHQLDRYANLWSIMLILLFNSKFDQFRKKGWKNGLFCVMLLFMMVMWVVFSFYLLLRSLQNMQCFSLRSFWKKIQVKSISNDAST